MPFEFSLAAVLRYRGSIEHREYLALQKLQQEIALLERKIQEVEGACLASVQNRAAELSCGVLAADLHNAYNYQTSLEQQGAALRSELQETRSKWERQLITYQAARRKREMLEKLRSQQANAYSREQEKREQARLDDIFLSRRERRD